MIDQVTYVRVRLLLDERRVLGFENATTNLETYFLSTGWDCSRGAGTTPRTAPAKLRKRHKTTDTYFKRHTNVRSRSVFATSQQNRDDERGAISLKSRNTSAAAILFRRSLSPSWPLPPNFSVSTIDEPLASFLIKGPRISSSVDGALFISHTSPPNS